MYVRKLAITLFLLPLLLAFSSESARAQFTLDATFRPRTELRNGYRLMRTAQTDPAFFTSQRTRLGLDYQSDLYRLHLAVQDVRTWGDVAQLQDNANVNVHEAWIALDPSSTFRLKMGRQELIYDNQRLLGSVNWTQQARSHDALVAQYHSRDDMFQLDVGAAYNQEQENLLGNTYSINNYKFLTYVWAKKKLGALDVSGLFLSDGFQAEPDKTNFRYTYGTYLDYSADNFGASGSVYLQSGDDLTRNNIAAHMFALNAHYGLESFQLSGGFDYLSGGSADDANPARHTFNTLYATNHKFYGHMDYFLNIPSDTRSGGLQDLHFGAGYNVGDKTNLQLTYHYLALANEISDPLAPAETTEQYLGSEFDLGMRYRATDAITFRAGFSTLFSGSALDAVQLRNGEDPQYWGWAMLQVSPTLFTTKD